MSDQKKEMTPEEIKLRDTKKAEAKKAKRVEKEKRLAEIKFKKLKDMTSEEKSLYYEWKETEARKKKNSSLKKALDDRLKAENDANRKFVNKYKSFVEKYESVAGIYEEFFNWSKTVTINHSKSDGAKMSVSIHDWFFVENHPEAISEEIVREYNS